jgi:phosphopantothenoylcysteine decarboxylase/phosphopantothenate--cysteine ligase
MAERNVVLGVTGSIAAYKAVDLASRLTQAGVAVHVVMTESATKLVAPASFRAITGHAVSTDLFELTNPFAIEHVSLADQADVFLVAPATANVMAKLATGIADDLLTCTALAARAPILVAPAMHTAMWEHPATQANVKTLLSRGVAFVGPETGRLASGGYGAGRFAAVEEILGRTLALLGRDGDLAGRKIVVTAGGTREPIDPVRYVGNRSSGKMGHAVAEAARDRGSSVTLVSAATALRPPAGVEVVSVSTAAEMLDATKAACKGADALIMAAAVADYAPTAPAGEKLKKTEAELVVRLGRTTDILAAIGNVPVRVGFAAESENLVKNARGKLAAKKLDLVVANDVGGSNPPFGSDENEVVLVTRDAEERLPRMSKRAVADRILDEIVARLRKP